METRYNLILVVISILIAILHSYMGFDLASRITVAKGRIRILLIIIGGLALGIGIWSMHFVGMFAFEMPGMKVSYKLSLVLLSFAFATINSGLTLFLFTRPSFKTLARLLGAITMASAIAGMHYIAMYSMHMDATIQWNFALVGASVLVAFIASLKALHLSYTLNKAYIKWLEFSSDDFSDRWPMIHGSIYLGLAIAGMHYTGMAAAKIVPSTHFHAPSSNIIGTHTLSTLVCTFSMLTLTISIAVGQIDRSLARSSARLRKEKELRNQFVSSIVHDLRNPLTAAILNVQMISKEGPHNSIRAHHRTALGTALENLNRIDLLIQSILDAQRINMGQPLPIHYEHVNLYSLLSNTLKGLTNIYGERFKLECDHSIAGEWDPKLLRRAVENLCTNAIKYGANNTPINIDVAVSNTKKDRVSIHIQNQGEPISTQEKQSLFELFKRGEKAEQGRQSGWGLGLSIVKGIAQGHGGRVLVESNREIGTVFTLELPMHRLNT